MQKRRKKKTAPMVVLIIVLALILVGELLVMSRCSRRDAGTAGGNAPAGETGTGPVQSEQFIQAPPATEEPAPVTPEPTVVPAPTAEPATPSPIPTQLPTPVPATASPVPTAAPGTVVDSGSASSDTGTALTMNVSWQATDMGGGTTRLSVTGQLESFSLQVMERPVTVQFGEASVTVTGSSVMVMDETHTVTDLFSATLDVPSGVPGDLTVSWDFGGTYSGVSLPTVTATDYVDYQ